MLDTDTSSYILKRSDAEVLKWLRMIPVNDVCISAIVKSELVFGVEVSPNRQRDEPAVSEFLRHVSVLDYPEGAALHYGQIRAALKTQGTPIGANDLLIAAHARYLDLTLATNNTRKFSRVPGLTIENWKEPPI